MTTRNLDFRLPDQSGQCGIPRIREIMISLIDLRFEPELVSGGFVHTSFVYMAYAREQRLLIGVPLRLLFVVGQYLLMRYVSLTISLLPAFLLTAAWRFVVPLIFVFHISVCGKTRSLRSVIYVSGAKRAFNTQHRH